MGEKQSNIIPDNWNFQVRKSKFSDSEYFGSLVDPETTVEHHNNNMSNINSINNSYKHNHNKNTDLSNF